MFTEALESRRMLSAAGYTFKSGVLTVSGGSKTDAITVVDQGGGNAHLELTDQAHKVFKQLDFTGVAAININGGGQGDTIFYTGNAIGAVIHGNGGNDAITVTDLGSGKSQAFGDGGDDSITLLHGNQTTVAGGDGKDKIFVNTDDSTPGGTAVVDAGKDNDSITVYNGSASVIGGSGFDSLLIRSSAGATATYGADVESVTFF